MVLPKQFRCMEDMDTTGTAQTLLLYRRHGHSWYCPNTTAVLKTWTQLVLPKQCRCMEDMDTTGTVQTLPLYGRHEHNRYCPNSTAVWKTWTQQILPKYYHCVWKTWTLVQQLVLPKHYHCMEDMDTTGTAQILLLYPLRNLRHCLKRNIGSSENMKRSTLLSYPVFLLQSLAA